MEYRYQLMIKQSSGSSLLSLEELARTCQAHPDFILRLVEIGLIEPTLVKNRYYFRPGVVDDIGRARRLHDDLGINWAGIGLVLDLLDRVADLEAELNRLRCMID